MGVSASSPTLSDTWAAGNSPEVADGLANTANSSGLIASFAALLRALAISDILSFQYFRTKNNQIIPFSAHWYATINFLDQNNAS